MNCSKRPQLQREPVRWSRQREVHEGHLKAIVYQRCQKERHSLGGMQKEWGGVGGGSQLRKREIVASCLLPSLQLSVFQHSAWL
jgi:hypothetical protein